jgi:hypothetical protein
MVQYKAKSRHLNEKTTKHFNEHSRSVSLDFNLGPLVHEASVLTIRLRKSIKINVQRTTTPTQVLRKSTGPIKAPFTRRRTQIPVPETSYILIKLRIMSENYC